MEALGCLANDAAMKAMEAMKAMKAMKAMYSSFRAAPLSLRSFSLQ